MLVESNHLLPSSEGAFQSAKHKFARSVRLLACMREARDNPYHPTNPNKLSSVPRALPPLFETFTPLPAHCRIALCPGPIVCPHGAWAPAIAILAGIHPPIHPTHPSLLPRPTCTSGTPSSASQLSWHRSWHLSGIAPPTTLVLPPPTCTSGTPSSASWRSSCA